MDHIKEFFDVFSDDSHRRNHHKVMALHEQEGQRWRMCSKRAPSLPKRWFEFSWLTAKNPLFDARDGQAYPRRRIPFHDRFGFPCYQCFWSAWYPLGEMGNVYYSGLAHTTSSTQGLVASPENMAFPTFLDGLMFYMGSILK